MKKRLYTEMEIADYTKLAEILSESRGEEYLNLVNIVVKECYSYEKTMYNHENDVDSVHFVYKKNEKMGKMYLGLTNLEKKQNKEDDRKRVKDIKLGDKLGEDRENLHQLEQAFLTLLVYDHKAVTVKNNSGNRGIEPISISVSQDKDKNLIIDFIRYGGDVGDDTCSYDHKYVNVTVSAPESGAIAEQKNRDDSWKYIRIAMGIDKTQEERMAVTSANYAMTIGFGRYMPLIGELITTVNYINDMSDAVTEEKGKEYAKAEKMDKRGNVIDKFKLNCVSSLVTEWNTAIFETQKVDLFMNSLIPNNSDDVRKGSMGTIECLENFNRNFSKGGIFEQYAGDIGYDEKNPVTVENITERIDEVELMVERWEKAVEKINSEQITEDSMIMRLEP